MDNLILLSWSAYLVCSAVLVLASWKLLFWLPLTLRLGVLFSQLAFLLIPAAVKDTASAPAFIVLVIDLLSRLPMDQALTKAAPLLAALVLAWPLAIILGWLRARQLKSAAQNEAANTDSETI